MTDKIKTFDQIGEEVSKIAEQAGGTSEDYLHAAIAILDSEFMNYPEGELESFLKHFLIEKTNK